MSTTALLLVALAIVPTQAHYTSAVIKVRGGAEKPGEVRAGQVDPSIIAGRTRIAVLPFKVPGADSTLASQRTGGMEAVLGDLRYVASYLVSDRSEIVALVRDRPEVSPSEVAMKLGLEEVIAGQLTVNGTGLGIKLTLYRVEDGMAKPIASVEAAGPRERFESLGDDALLSLLTSVKKMPPADRVVEMKKVATTSFTARSEVDAGFALLDDLVGKARAPEAVIKASDAALAHAKNAQKADRRYLRAYMLEASCLFNLGATPKLKDCLEQARPRNNPDKVDTLTRLEFEGDYLVHHDGKFADAAKLYEKMLDVDPGNLTALWSLTGLYSGDEASRFAGRIVLTHPQSAAAQVFTSRPSEP